MTELGLSPGPRRSWALPLNNPPVVPTAEASQMRPDDPVVGVLVDARARAYPWWIVANYHVVNDTWIDADVAPGETWTGTTAEDSPGAPLRRTTAVLVTLCEACSAASAFLPAFADQPENPLVFSTTIGRVPDQYHAVGTFTMSDLQTNSRWHPLSGQAQSGPFAGRQLRRVPAVLDRWDDWRRDFPDGDVLVAADEMRRRPHVAGMPTPDDPDAAHSSLVALRATDPGRIDHRLPPGELVLGIVGEAPAPVAWPLAAIRKAGGLVAGTVDDEPCTLVAAGRWRALAFSSRVAGRDLTFSLATGEPFRLVDDLGVVRNFFGEAEPGTGAPPLEPVPGAYVAKWSAWSVAHPGTRLIDCP